MFLIISTGRAGRLDPDVGLVQSTSMLDLKIRRARFVVFSRKNERLGIEFVVQRYTEKKERRCRACIFFTAASSKDAGSSDIGPGMVLATKSI